MIRHIRETLARRRGEELEAGFTLIELLIVIVVLGILAATVIFALSGVTGQSAQAACQSDGKSYEIAVAAYENAPANTTNAEPTLTTDLTGHRLRWAVPAPGGQQPALRGAAERRHRWPRRRPRRVKCGVGPTAATSVNYDAQSRRRRTGGCNAVT